jgi:cytochrome o ubiquinol oxidase subunit 2
MSNFRAGADGVNSTHRQTILDRIADMRLKNLLRTMICIALPAMLLSGCDMVLMNPMGDIAAQQRDVLILCTLWMLIIIIPVIVLTVYFAWRYRETNPDDSVPYEPDWHHSTVLELVIWAAPLIIIIALGALTWVSTHQLDPFRPISRLAPGQAVPLDNTPLDIEVVALDWKWLFIYPELNIATVNELAAPVDRPIHFKITSSSVMNTLYVPTLAGMIYAMPGMETQLHAVINKPGEYEGFSANYSGAGFSGMRFKFHGMSKEQFAQWARDSRKSGAVLSRDEYLKLVQPSEREPVRHYAAVNDELYDAILNRCVEDNRMCIRDMVAIDMRGGMGDPGTYNIATNASLLERLGLPAQSRRMYVGAVCMPNSSKPESASNQLSTIDAL